MCILSNKGLFADGKTRLTWIKIRNRRISNAGSGERADLVMRVAALHWDP